MEIFSPLSGRQLRLLRKAQHLTLADVARVTRISVPTLSRIERSERDGITLRYARDICAMFDRLDEHDKENRT